MTHSFPTRRASELRITDGTHTTLAAAGPLNPLELRDPRSTGAVAEPLVDESGGTVRRIAGNDLPMLRKVAADRDRFGRDWIGLKRGEGYVVTGVLQIPVLPALLVLCLSLRSEEHTSELQSLMRISYAVFCLKKKIRKIYIYNEQMSTENI